MSSFEAPSLFVLYPVDDKLSTELNWVINTLTMMTFKEYLLESNIMSDDALKSAMSDYDNRRMGKTDGSKPKTKRLDQMDKRRKRKAGHVEEEEPVAPARRDRVQGIANTPNEIGRRPSSEREFQRMKRRVRRTRGIGSTSKGAMPIDDL